MLGDLKVKIVARIVRYPSITDNALFIKLNKKQKIKLFIFWSFLGNKEPDLKRIPREQKRQTTPRCKAEVPIPAR